MIDHTAALISPHPPLVMVSELPDPDAVTLLPDLPPLATKHTIRDLPGTNFGHEHTTAHHLKLHVYKPVDEARLPRNAKDAGALYVEHIVAGVSTFYRCNHSPFARQPMPLMYLPEWVLHAAITFALSAGAHSAAHKEKEVATAIVEAANQHKIKIRKKRKQNKVRVSFLPTEPEHLIVEHQNGHMAVASLSLYTHAFSYEFPVRGTAAEAQSDWDNRAECDSYTAWEAAHTKRTHEVSSSDERGTPHRSPRKPSVNSIFRHFR